MEPTDEVLREELEFRQQYLGYRKTRGPLAIFYFAVGVGVIGLLFWVLMQSIYWFAPNTTKEIDAGRERMRLRNAPVEERVEKTPRGN